MRVEKLTETRIDKLVVPEGKAELLVWERSGLGVRVGRLRRKTLVIQYRVRGRQHRMVLGTFPHLPLAAARAKAAEVLAQVDRGEDPAVEASLRDEGPTLRDFAATYLDRHARPNKRSASDDAGMFEGWIVARLGDRPLDSIRRADVAKLHSEIGAAGHPVRANRCLALLSHVFTCAERWGALPEGSPNPARGIQKFPEQARECLLSAEELGRLGDALRAREADHPLGVAALRLILFLGARRSEITHLRWAEVDLGARCLRLGAARTKEKRPKTLPLHAPALAVLAALPRLEDELVFPGQRPGRPIGGALDALWNRVRAGARLETLRIHDLRHLNASDRCGNEHG